MTAKVQHQAWNQILALVTPFRKSCILFAALELNVFDGIPESGSTLAEIAEKIGMSPQPQSTEQLLNALVACQYFIRFEGRYYPADEVQFKYLRSGENTIKKDLLLFKQENQVWLNLAAIIREREPVPSAYSRELLDNRIIQYSGICNANRQFAVDTL